MSGRPLAFPTPVIAVTDKSLQTGTLVTGNALWLGQHTLELYSCPCCWPIPIHSSQRLH